MQYLKNESADASPLIRNLEKVDAHLRETGNTFMVTDHLTRADCYVLPTLQHIRVAGKVCAPFTVMERHFYILCVHVQPCHSSINSFLQ